jgi:hypothetical protein
VLGNHRLRHQVLDGAADTHPVVERCPCTSTANGPQDLIAWPASAATPQIAQPAVTIRLDNEDVPQRRIDLAHADSQQDIRRSLLEIAQRAKSGTYLHLPIWLLIAVSSGLPSIAPMFFWCNTAYFGALTMVRILLHRRFTLWLDTHPVATVRVGFALMMLPTLQWGMLSAETIFFDSLRG